MASLDASKVTDVVVAVQQARYRQQQAFDTEDDAYVRAHAYHTAQLHSSPLLPSLVPSALLFHEILASHDLLVMFLLRMILRLRDPGKRSASRPLSRKLGLSPLLFGPPFPLLLS